MPEYHPGREVGEKIELLDVVALTHDIPDYNLRRGEVGTVVEILSNGDAFEVEFSDCNGRAYQFFSARASQLIVLRYGPMQTEAAAPPEQMSAD